MDQRNEIAKRSVGSGRLTLVGDQVSELLGPPRVEAEDVVVPDDALGGVPDPVDVQISDAIDHAFVDVRLVGLELPPSALRTARGGFLNITAAALRNPRRSRNGQIQTGRDEKESWRKRGVKLLKDYLLTKIQIRRSSNWRQRK